jgi:lysozyme family protein
MLFQKCLKKLFQTEGFFSDRPYDLGGATKYGITLASLSSFRKAAVSKKDVMELTEAEAIKFYFEMYWTPLRCDEYGDDLLALVVFDQAVNRGIGTVIKDLQLILNNDFKKVVKIDGVLGSETLLSLKDVDKLSLSLFIILLAQQRYCRIVEKNPTQIVFITGWINRTQALLLEAYKEIMNAGINKAS